LNAFSAVSPPTYAFSAVIVSRGAEKNQTGLPPAGDSPHASAGQANPSLVADEAPSAQLPAVFAAQTNPGDNPDRDLIITNIQHDFIQSVQAGSRNPNDPQYARDWEVARAAADDRLRAQLGQDEFNQIVRDAGQISTAPSGQ
jgi:hypothetical protein